MSHDHILAAIGSFPARELIKQWLKAGSVDNGVFHDTPTGTGQGSVISPVLANLFLHYALDSWLGREFPAISFERYADDVILHCKTQQQAQVVLDAIIERLAQVGLELNLDKTRVVYCKDSNRKGSHEHEQFTFLGYTFRPRLARSKTGMNFVSFLPAVSDDAAKRMRRTIRRWRLHLRSGAVPDKDRPPGAGPVRPLGVGSAASGRMTGAR